VERRVAILGIAIAAVALVACQHSARATSTGRPPTPVSKTKGTRISGSALAAADVGGRFIHPFVVGGLRVTPGTGHHRDAPLGLDLAEAEKYVALTRGLADGEPASGQQIVGYGRVTLTGVAPPDGTPVLRGRRAWVGIVLGTSRPLAFCPMHRVPPRGGGHSSSGPAATTFQPIDSVVIFYGRDGRGAVLYRTGGSSPCGGTTRPRVTVADAEVSVPWVQIGPAGLVTSIGYRAPACALLFGVGSSGNVRTGFFSVGVTILFPFDRTGCRSVKRFTTTVTVFPPNAGPDTPTPPNRVVLRHAPVTTSIPPSLVGPSPFPA